MSQENAALEGLEFGVYEQSQLNIRRLKERLPEDLVASLAREVIRRLAGRDRNLQSVAHEPQQRDLEALCHALISDDDDAAARMIVDVRADGASPEAVYLKYLAAAARMLGDWWVEDRANFVEVTVATGRLFAIMRSMRRLFEPTRALQGKAAIFASVPGEDHTLGVRMAADLFRKEGWEIALKIGLDHDTLVAEIEDMPSCIIGLSVGGQHSMDPLSKLIVALHICCPNAPLVVSGQDVASRKPLLDLMGVDAIAGDVDEAKALMDDILMRRAAQPA